MEKEDCYSCIYRGGLADSAHSRCNHPLVSSENNNPLGEMLAMFGSAGRMPPIMMGTEKLNIKGNEHGIRHGWFNWPWNFDPVWLENCDGFKSKGGDEVCATE